MAHLNVHLADLLKAADDYTELAARAALISPQAAAEVTRIIETHGAMGYPVAVGIVTGLAPREAQVAAKVADFGRCAKRFTEHAATYHNTDTDGGSGMAGHFQKAASTDAQGHPGSGNDARGGGDIGDSVGSNWGYQGGGSNFVSPHAPGVRAPMPQIPSGGGGPVFNGPEGPGDASGLFPHN